MSRLRKLAAFLFLPPPTWRTGLAYLFWCAIPAFFLFFGLIGLVCLAFFLYACTTATSPVWWGFLLSLGAIVYLGWLFSLLIRTYNRIHARLEWRMNRCNDILRDARIARDAAS